MMAANPFPGWLADVVADAVVVRPDDIDAEARGNLWSFALMPEQCAAISVADVEAFAVAVADGRWEWLVAHDAGPMVLYWWHDTQAGQLRFSLVSAAHNRLPFGCQVSSALCLSEVVRGWLGSPHRHGVSWSELQSLASGEATPESPLLVLPVWSVQLPQTPRKVHQPTTTPFTLDSACRQCGGS